MPHDHHEHDHGGEHHEGANLTDMDIRVRALETLLTDKGLIDPAAIDRIVQTYEHEIGPRNGARVVARIWTDPAFAAWCRRDATAAIHSMGYVSRQGEHMVTVENDAATHHMTVCTLCSCYPWSVLGLPPTWYKSPAYRSRAVIDPRGVLLEFGVTLPEGVSVEVHDSTAETRYLVIPRRPEGTGGLDADALAALVTRDGMIGTAPV